MFLQILRVEKVLWLMFGSKKYCLNLRDMFLLSFKGSFKGSFDGSSKGPLQGHGNIVCVGPATLLGSVNTSCRLDHRPQKFCGSEANNVAGPLPGSFGGLFKEPLTGPLKHYPRRKCPNSSTKETCNDLKYWKNKVIGQLFLESAGRWTFFVLEHYSIVPLISF